LNVASVEPMSHVLAIKNVYRKDAPKESLEADKAMDNAPQKEGGMFRVPRVI
ncbi:MAG: Asp-tRNA(Asn)/Glu-tRNA(Gln) amidotransferase subunit GatC, partial [Candidatus Omnitrophica bacterium]|nr:Asp-tRNA(Asn)/Glu-tRNA(Gln) amidotransferase subunit GatC [Candidatus Omnitrophota bacterium]